MATYPAIAASAPMWASPRGNPTTHRGRDPAASRTTFRPDTASRRGEPRAPGACLEPGRERCVVSEHDAGDHRAPVAVRPGTASRRSQSRRRSAIPPKSAAATDDPPVVDAQDDVHALTTQPAPLVEPVRRPARQSYDADDRHAGSLRRRAARRAASRSTGSCGRDEPQRRTTARTRTSKRPTRGGSCVSTVARSADPASGSRTLRSSSCNRWLPHHQPATARTHGARAQASTVAAGSGEKRAAFDAARPAQSETSSHVALTG